MNPLLEQSLYEKYPEFFQRKELNPKKTCMCWGIDCEDGWYYLIERACMKLKDYLNERCLPLDSFQFDQIKEKFGTLRLHYNCSEDVDYIIQEAERDSAYTCERCGSNKGARVSCKSWCFCRCSYCYSKGAEE